MSDVVNEEFDEESEGYTDWLRGVAQQASRYAAESTFLAIGYNTVVMDGYVVKINKEGKVLEVVSEVPLLHYKGWIALRIHKTTTEGCDSLYFTIDRVPKQNDWAIVNLQIGGVQSKWVTQNVYGCLGSVISNNECFLVQRTKKIVGSTDQNIPVPQPQQSWLNYYQIVDDKPLVVYAACDDNFDLKVDDAGHFICREDDPVKAWIERLKQN